MPTEPIKDILDFSKYKGLYGALSILVSLTVIILKLPDTAILRIKETWFIIAIPAFLVLTITLFQAYLDEQKNRTRIEEQISAKLNEIAISFSEAIDRVLSKDLDFRMYMDRELDSIKDRFDILDERQMRIYAVLEKRSENGKRFTHTGDTEKFLHSDKKGD